ncbi:MAG: SUMF1/EgtB/PvdO family nonheme iron enzyme, partial [Spirochaetaceae bacterium]|nr:SUMF1/EgtB/PvdO family nonheme iron enzyme [Spirochaetaceae bacterium]
FNFTNIRVINTVSGKTVQTTALNKTEPRTMTPAQELREIVGIVASEKENLSAIESYIALGNNLATAEKNVAADKKLAELSGGSKMVLIPNKNFTMLNTEVTQKLYQAIMGENPSKFKGEKNPVESVSWYEAIYFCNKLSEKCGLTPVYAVDGNTDVRKWVYTSHKANMLRGQIPVDESAFRLPTLDESANGFRLPWLDEWQYAAKGGENYDYSGSDNLDEVGWYRDNSGRRTHPVAQKKPNGYGLYDMSGNVWEWVWDSRYSYERLYCGGSWRTYGDGCKVGYRDISYVGDLSDYQGFRIVRTVSK